jgi:hypothetical protein
MNESYDGFFIDNFLYNFEKTDKLWEKISCENSKK